MNDHSIVCLGDSLGAGMSLEKFLSDKKTDIIKEWVDAVLNSYEAPGFFKKQKDCIANPVGFTVKEELKNLFTMLASNGAISDARHSLDAIIKIRAVQDFTPARAVSFVFDLKDVIRAMLVKGNATAGELTGLDGLERRIDQLALLAFDLFMENRELLFRVRLREMQSGRHILTDGTQCPSAIIRRTQKESTANNQIISTTEAR